MDRRGFARSLRITFVGFVLIGSGMMGIFVRSVDAAKVNWDGPFANNQNWDNAQQNIITPSNVANLQVSWLFSFPALPSKPLWFNLPPYSSNRFQGPGAPAVIHDGIVYENTQGYDIYAFDAATGKVIWHRAGLEPAYGPAGHVHGLRYYNGMIWTPNWGTGWGGIVGIDALTGDIKVNISDIGKNVPGQRYTPLYGKNLSTRWLYVGEWPPTFYKNIALVQGSSGDFIVRGYVKAYDINTGNLLWSRYTSPPSPNCDPNWDFKDLVVLGNGQVVDYGQPKGNIQPYRGDWGTDCTLNGAANPWLSAAVDNETGIFYFSTSAAYPFGYGAYRPGPNLYGDSIIAINATSGKMIWFYQATTHDLPGELDCNWSVLLIKVNGQKQIAAPCRNYLYGLDATNGQLLWSYDPTQVKATGTNPTTFQIEGTNLANARNMTIPYAGYPGGYATNSSGNENAPAFDGKDTVFYWNSVSSTCVGGGYAANSNLTVPAPPYFPFLLGDRPGCTAADKAKFKFTPPGSNLVAVSASTGKLLWADHFNATQIGAYRGGLTYTNGILLGGAADGNLYAFDAQTGKVIWSKYMGVALSYAPSIGTTADGKMMAFLPVGGGILWGLTPGFLAAFSLPAFPSAVTTTTTATSVSVSTAVSTTGVDPTTFYGAVAVAVIFVIATGVLALRRRQAAT